VPAQHDCPLGVLAGRLSQPQAGLMSVSLSGFGFQRPAHGWLLAHGRGSRWYLLCIYRTGRVQRSGEHRAACIGRRPVPLTAYIRHSLETRLRREVDQRKRDILLYSAVVATRLRFLLEHHTLSTFRAAIWRPSTQLPMLLSTAIRHRWNNQPDSVGMLAMSARRRPSLPGPSAALPMSKQRARSPDVRSA
jgi:hypothetical protein